MGGVAQAAGGAAMQGVRSAGSRVAQSFRDSVQRGRDAAWTATGGAPRSVAGGGDPASGAAGAGDGGPAATGGSATASEGPPAWARKMRAEQNARHHRQMLIHTIKDGDRGGAPANPSLKED
jgi:type IV secretion system protein TrbL